MVDAGIRDPSGRAKRPTGEVGWLQGAPSSVLTWWLSGSHDHPLLPVVLLGGSWGGCVTEALGHRR